MTRGRHRSRWFGLSLFGLFACVRMADPGDFKCESDADCGSAEHCIRPDANDLGDCHPESYCLAHSDCDAGQVCIVAERTCRVPECTMHECGGYRCDLETYTCRTSCYSHGCAADFSCYEGTCHPVDAGDGKSGLGAACSMDSQCASAFCCSRSGSGTCTLKCNREGESCEDDSKCAGLLCCPNRYTTGSSCESECTLGSLGDACGNDAYCTSGKCIDDMCVGLAGSPCATNADCETEGGGFCQTGGATTAGGYCTRACMDGCGHDATGRENVCIEQYEATPYLACKPGCATDSDCEAIHPDLHCLSSGLSNACDFSAANWH